MYMLSGKLPQLSAGGNSSCTVKKTGPRGVRFEGCYSLGSVMATHKGIQLTSMGVGRLLAAYPTKSGVLSDFIVVLS